MFPAFENRTSGIACRRGQAMIESCIVILFLCLLFLGLFQLAHAHVSREVLNYAAARAARAKTVGFNQWMVKKTMRVAAIPNAGQLLEPVVPGGDLALSTALSTLGLGDLWEFVLHSTPQSPTIHAELARIPEYMASENESRAVNLLNYEYWAAASSNQIVHTIVTGVGAILNPSGGNLITVHVAQDHNLLADLGSLNNGDLDAPGCQIRLHGHYSIEAHYPLYINDSYW